METIEIYSYYIGVIALVLNRIYLVKTKEAQYLLGKLIMISICQKPWGLLKNLKTSNTNFMAKINDIDKYIDQQAQDFNFWITSINNYLDYRYSDEELHSDELWKVTTECVDAFARIAELCLKYGRFKDTWDYNHYYQHVYGPELIIKSLKTGIDYRLGLDNKGIYLSVDLRYNENLRYMDDTFWKILLDLSDFEDFIYEEYEFVRDERVKNFPDLFKTNKSMIYKIMRKYIFDSTEIDPQYRHGSVGELKILCPLNKDFVDIVKEFCLTFKIMYQLNYELWKISF